MKTAKSSSDPGQKANGRGNQIPEQDSDYAYELLPSKIQEIEEKKRLGGAPGSADGHEKGSVHCHCDWEEEEAEMVSKRMSAVTRPSSKIWIAPMPLLLYSSTSALLRIFESKRCPAPKRPCVLLLSTGTERERIMSKFEKRGTYEKGIGYHTTRRVPKQTE